MWWDSISSGGIIAPGNGVGQMNMFGILTFQSGSSLLMELGVTNSGQSDRIVVEGNLNLGGTLNVTNLPGFGAGTYILFTYDGFLTGSMAIGSMPSGYNYAIDTSVVGEVRLVVTQTSGGGVDTPSFKSIKLVGDKIVMTATGLSNFTYRVLISTNIALPVNLWTPIVTNTFSASGPFSMTNSVDFSTPQTFYLLLRSP